MLWDGGHRLSVLRQFICGIIIIAAYPVSSLLPVHHNIYKETKRYLVQWWTEYFPSSWWPDRRLISCPTSCTQLHWWPNWSANRGSSAGIVKPLQLDTVVAVVAATCAMQLMLPGHCLLLTPWRTLGAVSRERWSCHQHHRWLSHDAEDAKIPQMYVCVGASLGRWEKGKPWLLSHRG